MGGFVVGLFLLSLVSFGVTIYLGRGAFCFVHCFLSFLFVVCCSYIYLFCCCCFCLLLFVLLFCVLLFVVVCFCFVFVMLIFWLLNSSLVGRRSVYFEVLVS